MVRLIVAIQSVPSTGSFIVGVVQIEVGVGVSSVDDSV